MNQARTISVWISGGIGLDLAGFIGLNFGNCLGAQTAKWIHVACS